MDKVNTKGTALVIAGSATGATQVMDIVQWGILQFGGVAMPENVSMAFAGLIAPTLYLGINKLHSKLFGD